MAFALPLPNGRVQFLDRNGAPLEAGTVQFAEPGGLTPKDTWQDYDRGTRNDNPLTLDILGSASIWGSGRYRQIVKDSLGNLIWDKETAVLTDRPYEAGFYCGATAADDAVLGEWPFTQAVTFPTNWDGSFAVASTGGSAIATVDIKLVSGATVTTIGSMSIATTGVVTLTSSVSDPNFQPQDRFRWQLNGSAHGFAGLSANFLGVLDG